MKFSPLAFIALSLFTSAAVAQTFTNTPIQHVIVVIQENRTPDNLFGSNPGFLTGANITNVGKKGSSNVNLQSTPIYTCYDLGHAHSDFLAMWDNGNMDGAYNESIFPLPGCGTPQPPLPPAMYAYASNGLNTSPPKEVQPYFDIALNYGFANYMVPNESRAKLSRSPVPLLRHFRTCV